MKTNFTILFLFIITVMISSCDAPPAGWPNQPPAHKSAIMKTIKNKGVLIKHEYTDSGIYIFTIRTDSNIVHEIVTRDQYHFVSIGDTIK
jgi:hypothetical protein